MQSRWTFRWTVVLLIGRFSIQPCQAQEPTEDNGDDEPFEIDDSILSHIHFSDNTEEEWSSEDDRNGSDDESQPVNQDDLDPNQIDNSTLHDTAQDNKTAEEEPPPAKSEYQRPVCKEGEGCDIPLNCYDFIANGPRDIVPDPPKAVELTPLELQNLLGNGTYKNCCALVMFYAPWCEYSVNFAQKFNAIGRTFLKLPVIAVDLSAHDP